MSKRKEGKFLSKNKSQLYIDELFPEEPEVSDVDYCELMARVAGVTLEAYERNADSVDDNGDDFGDCYYVFGYDC